MVYKSSETNDAEWSICSSSLWLLEALITSVNILCCMVPWRIFITQLRIPGKPVVTYGKGDLLNWDCD